MTATAASIVSALGWALLDFVWQGVVIGVGTAFVLRLLRDARPQARYLVAVGAMALCLLLPIAQVGVAMTADVAPMAASQVVTVADEAIVVRDVAFAVPHAAWPQRLHAQLPWLVTAWALGAALLALRMALGLAWVRRIGRNSPDIADAAWQARLTQLAIRFGLTRKIALRVSSDIDSPVAAGWWRPIVLVPAALVARMPPDLLEALLAHELAHIRRHDYLVNLAQSAVEALLFYHPVTWWLSRRIRLEREQIADDLAAQVLGEPRRLALALQELDRLQFSPTTLALAANGGHLMSRIQRLIRPHGRATTWHSLTWRLALPILALAAVCVSVYAQDKASSPGETGSTDVSRASTPSIVVGSNAVVAVNADAATDVVTAEVIRNEVPVDDVERVVPANELALVDTDAAVAPMAPVSPVSPPIAPVAPTPPTPPMPAPAPMPMARPAPIAAPAPAAAPMPAPMPRRSVYVNTEGKGDGYAIVHANDADVTFSGNTRDLSEVEKLRAKIGGDFLWFRRGGQSYIVRDPALVAQANAAWKPAEPVNAKMEALSRQMEVHSRKMDALSRRMEATSQSGEPANADMERISAKMEALGTRQEALSAQSERLSDKMQSARSDAERGALIAEMSKLHERMQPLSAQMNELAAEMNVHSRKLEAAHQPMDAISREMEQAAKPMQALGEQMGALGKQQEKLSLEADRKVKSLIDQAARTGQAQPAGSAAPR